MNRVKKINRTKYKHIYFIKIFLALVFLGLLLYLSFSSNSNIVFEDQKILFVVDSSKDTLDSSKSQMLSLLSSLDDRFGDRISVGLVSVAGFSEVEVPFVKDKLLLQRYIEALVPEENFEGKNLDELKLLLDDMDIDRMIMFPDPNQEDIAMLINDLEPNGLAFMQNGKIVISLLLLVLLILIV